MRYLGLDVGTRKIGIALSDPEGVISQGLCVITYASKDSAIKKIIELVNQHGVDKIVVGVPKNLDGSEGRLARFVLSFVDKLKAHLQKEIILWDERFSTNAVNKIIMETGLSLSKRKRLKDFLSAQWILAGYLESIHTYG